MDLATEADVVKRLGGRTLTDDELGRLPGLMQEASVLVEGYLGTVYSVGDVIPEAVVVVTSRMVARVFSTPDVPDGVTAEMMTAGPFQLQRSFSDGTNSAEPWLSKNDKTALRLVVGGAMMSVAMVSDRCR